MTATKNAQANGRSKPSDMELMLYVDGELDDARHSEVSAHLEHSEEARLKVAALRMVSNTVRGQNENLLPSIDIASAVMAKIESGEASETGAVGAGAKVIELRGSKPVKQGGAKASNSANDNARGIFTLAAIAVAAAAGMMIWGRMDAAPQQSAQVNQPAITQTQEAVAAPAESTAPTAAAEAANSDNEPEHGVEVAAVDFGAHMGSIFYVPAETVAGGTTTVVWVEDEAAGGKQ